MKTYKSGNVPEKYEADFFRREFLSMEQAANRADPMFSLTYLQVLPDRPSDGLYLSAAGVLGVTRGLYRYDSVGGTYTFIG